MFILFKSFDGYFINRRIPVESHYMVYKNINYTEKINIFILFDFLSIILSINGNKDTYVSLEHITDILCVYNYMT